MSKSQLKQGTFSIFPCSLATARDPYDQVILAWLWKHKNQDGICFPSLNTLAKEAGMSKGMVCKCLKRLETDGLITRSQRERENGSNTSNSYELSLPYEQGVISETTLVSNVTTPGHNTDNHNYIHSELDSGKIVPPSKNSESGNPPPTPPNLPQGASTPCPDASGGGIATPAQDLPPATPLTKAPAKPAKATWLTPYDTIWHAAFGGHIAFGMAAKVFKQLEADYGRERTLEGWGAFCRDMFAKGKAQYASPGNYARTPLEWMPKTSESSGAPAYTPVDKNTKFD